MLRTMKFILVLALICALSFTSALLNNSPFVRIATATQRRQSLVVVNQALGKADIAEILKDKTGLTKKDIELMLTAFAETVQKEVLVNGNEIRLREFGTFKQKKSAARLGRNPRTGEDLQIQGSTSVSFSVSSTLKLKDGEEVTAISKPVEVKVKKEKALAVKKEKKVKVEKKEE